MSETLLIGLIQWGIKFGIDGAIALLKAHKNNSIDDAIAALETAKSKTAADYLAAAGAAAALVPGAFTPLVTGSLVGVTANP